MLFALPSAFAFTRCVGRFSVGPVVRLVLSGAGAIVSQVEGKDSKKIYGSESRKQATHTHTVPKSCREVFFSDVTKKPEFFF